MRVKTKLHFKADKLNTYRFCDNVWTFMLKEVEFRENAELAKVDRLKLLPSMQSHRLLPALMHNKER